MQTTQREYVDRPPRTPVPKGVPARVTLRRLGEERTAAIDAELIDISSGGTKLRISAPLHFEESVEMHIEIPCIDMDCHVLAMVRHIREAEDGRWIVGCSVQPPLDEHGISGLATYPIVERRRWPREQTSLRATVRQQLGRVDSEAVIQNFAPGGFCILLTGPCEVGERIHVTLSEPPAREASIESRVHWQLQSSEGYRTGCTFVCAADYHVVEAAAAARATKDAIPADGKPAPKGLGIIAWGAVSCATCAISLLFMHANVDDSASARTGTEVVEAAPRRPDETPVANENADGNASPEAEPARPVRPAHAASPSPVGKDVQAPPADRSGDDSTRGPELREWVDDTGQYRVMAVLLAVRDDHVLLRRADGKEIEVPFGRLSADDVDYAKRQTTISVPQSPER